MKLRTLFVRVFNDSGQVKKLGGIQSRLARIIRLALKAECASCLDMSGSDRLARSNKTALSAALVTLDLKAGQFRAGGLSERRG